MRKEVSQLPLPLFFAAVVIAFGLVAFLVTTLRHDTLTVGETSADRTFRSPLQPEDWQTYGGDVWSMGYPSDWNLTVADGVLTFRPEMADRRIDTYFSVARDTRSAEEIALALATDPDMSQASDFLFAGYETTKYTLTSGREIYYVDYSGDVYQIVTDAAEEPEIGIMLATFQFLY